MDREFLEGLGLEAAHMDAILEAHTREMEQLRQTHDGAMTALQLERAVETAGGRSLKAITALLEPEELQAGGDLQEAVARIRKEHPYLFRDTHTPPPLAGGTGGNSNVTAPETLASALRERFMKKN